MQAAHQPCCLQPPPEGSPQLCLSFPTWPSPAGCSRRETQTVAQKRSYCQGQLCPGEIAGAATPPPSLGITSSTPLLCHPTPQHGPVTP